MNISRNAMFNLMLARQNDTMSKHTNDIWLSSMGGALSLLGSKNLYNALDEEIKEKDNEISTLKNLTNPIPNNVLTTISTIYSMLNDDAIKRLNDKLTETVAEVGGKEALAAILNNPKVTNLKGIDPDNLDTSESTDSEVEG